MGNFLFFPNQDTQDYILDTYSTGVQFGYSKYKLSSSATDSITAQNSSSLTEDIALGSIDWDTAQLETFANGSLATSETMIDQISVYGDLAQATQNKQPTVTDASGIALDYFFLNAQGVGYYDTIKTPPSTANDYIISLVMRNETVTVNNRPTYQIKTGATDLFAFQITREGTFYNVNAIRNQEGLNVRQMGYIHTPANFTDWELYTFAVIGGVVTLYINGAAITWGSVNTGDAMDTRGVAGVSLGIKPFATSQSREFDYETFIMHSGLDLSGFPLTDYMNDLITLHGITI